MSTLREELKRAMRQEVPLATGLETLIIDCCVSVAVALVERHHEVMPFQCPICAPLPGEETR